MNKQRLADIRHLHEKGFYLTELAHNGLYSEHAIRDLLEMIGDADLPQPSKKARQLKGDGRV